MGTSPDQLFKIAELYGRGLLPKACLVADFGCQQLWGGNPSDVEAFVRAFNIGLQTDDLDKLASNGAFIGHIFKAVGWDYLSFDIVEAPFCEQFDLNIDSVALGRCNSFDLVLNFGTTEHVMNQFNAMKALHDSAKLGGLIYSYFIRGGYMEHGLVHYSDRFVDLWLGANKYQTIWREDFNVPGNECTWIVVRKTSPAEFKPIVDVEIGEERPVLRA